MFITVQNTGGDFGLSEGQHPYVFLGGLAGLAKTAALEWPKAFVKSIDICKNNKTNEELADLLFNELTAGGPEFEVGIVGIDQRLTLKNEEARAGQSRNYIDENSIIVVSGGARGVTAVSTIELAKRFRPKIVLIGRTKIYDEPDYLKGVQGDAAIKKAILDESRKNGKVISPAKLGEETNKVLAQREIKDNLNKIKEAGSIVKYYSADITDYDSIRKCLEEVRSEWGEITGFVHGAGVIADKLIIDKTEAQFDMVFRTKVEGLRNLLKATEDDNLKVICLFSSVAGRFGNMGQCDYAMANEILNKVANCEQRKRGNNCIVKSINWGPWEGGMVTPFLKKHMEQMGIPLIPLQEGARAFCDELTYENDENAEVIIGPSLPEGGFTIFKEEEKEYELLVDKNSFPYLESHQIKGAVVAPATVAADWMLRGAKAFKPLCDINRIENIKVLKGIQVINYNKGESLVIKIKCKEMDGHIQAVLQSADNKIHYSSDVFYMNKSKEKSVKTIDSFRGINTEAWPFGAEEAYSKYLFHGRYLHVIKELLNISTNGASATLIGGMDVDWPYEYYLIDPALLDGGLQMQLLWGYVQSGRYVLPTHIKGISLHATGLMKGPIHVELEKVSVDSTKTVCNIYFFDNTGQLLYEINEATMTVLLSDSIKH